MVALAFVDIGFVSRTSLDYLVQAHLMRKFSSRMVFSSVGLEFDRSLELNKSAIRMFDIRNAVVHPKMKLDRIDEHISRDEYERRSIAFTGVLHPLRSELTREQVAHLKGISDSFVSQWGPKLLDGAPDYWLTGGSTGGFTHEPTTEGGSKGLKESGSN